MSSSIETKGLAAIASKLVLGVLVVVACTLASRLRNSMRVKRILSTYPMANEKWDAAGKKHFTENADRILADAVAQGKGRPFRLNVQSRARLIIPPKYIEEIKNEKNLDFHAAVGKEFFAGYPGFDAFSTSVNQTIFQDAVRTQLTQALALTVEPLAKEAPNTLQLVYGSDAEWKETVLTPSLLKCVGRLTALIFLGEKFMNDAEWQRISIMYTVDAFIAAQVLNAFPAVVRPIIHWFLPQCRKIREEVKLARALITPEVNRRRKELAENAGKPRRKVLDSVDWFTAAAKGQDFDYANGELSLAMASIHTTTNTLGFAICDLLENPEYIPLLREEIKRVIEEDGKWEKSTLFKMKLMDSVLKESMRLHPQSLVNMPRQAKADVHLPDGVTIPKDAFMMVGPVLMTDPSIYPNVDKFDGHRFLKMRDAPGAENKHQFVTTTPECTMFGYGSHSCPGRFFASNELKLLLAHMLLYYDWKLPDGQTKVHHTINGISRSPNSRQKVMFKSRTPEVVIDYSE
ncbi:cytochrome P450 [Leptodontidium sp. MPI-SDFR-AT-0119]|nr:cytochrome P450 [Leptodontidium sp. MPI-SDFR-AT-0119]